MSLRRYFNTPRSARLNPERLAIRRGKGAIAYSASALAVFAIVFSVVRKNGSAHLDTTITRAVQRIDNPVFDRTMRVVSWPGFPPQSRILPPSIAAILWFRGMRLEALFQMAAWGAGGMSHIVKRSMRRARPTIDVAGIRVVPARIGGTSFPSGHVLIYSGVYGFLAFLASIWVRPNPIRRAAVGSLGAILSLVGLSRIYLGHHWFTDVIASYMLGTTWLIALSALYRKTKFWMLDHR